MEIYLYLREFPVEADAPLSGPMKAVHGLAAGLAACGAVVTVLCEGPGNAERKHAGYRIRRFQNNFIDARFLLSPDLKDFLARSFRQGIVVLNGLFNPSLFSLGAWLRHRGIPYIAAPHSSYHPALFGRNPHLKWPYWYLFERPFLNWSKAIQALDMRQGELILSRGVDKPIFEVPNGFVPDEAPPEDQLCWPSGSLSRLIYFGRLDTHTKGLDILMEAFDRLSPFWDVSLTMQGPNSGDRKRLERSNAKSYGRVPVSFIDGDFHRPAPRILSDYDIVCLPSRYEGFGLAALEAMIAGRVLLVSRTAGIAPHVEAAGCGVVVDPDVDQIHCGLIRLLHLKSRWREMGLSGRRYAFANLRWETIAQEALLHYGAVVRGHSGDETYVPVLPRAPEISPAVPVR